MPIIAKGYIYTSVAAPKFIRFAACEFGSVVCSIAASKFKQQELSSSMAAKIEQRTYEDAVGWLRDHGFDMIEAPGAQTRVFMRKYNCSAAIQKTDDGGAKIFAYPGYMIGSEISKLVNKGYQQFLKTTKTEVPATADHLKALQQFSEELKEALNLPSLYNESLGTVSESYQYDRIKDRDRPEADRPKRPWETAQPKAKAATAAKKTRP